MQNSFERFPRFSNVKGRLRLAPYEFVKFVIFDTTQFQSISNFYDDGIGAIFFDDFYRNITIQFMVHMQMELYVK